MKKYNWIVAVFVLLAATLACGLQDLSSHHRYITLKPAANQTLDDPTLNKVGDIIWKRLKFNGIKSSYTVSDGELLFTIPFTGEVGTYESLLTDKGEIDFVDSTQAFTAGDTIDSNLPVILTNADIQNVKVTATPNGDGFTIPITLTSTGTKKMADYSSKNIGHYLIIVRDSKVISSPVVNSAITKGDAVIQGNFTKASAGELAAILISESLPCSMIIWNSNVK
jgi:preprotein translocase subunit SecD